METQSQNMDKVGEAQLNQTLLLKTTMDIVPQLVEALEGAESGRLRMIKMVITSLLMKNVDISTRPLSLTNN